MASENYENISSMSPNVGGNQVPAGDDQIPSTPIATAPDSNKQRTKRRSERQREASRANGKHSHGPKTERGKAYSRGNAFKHGMLARNATVFHSNSPESAEEFDKYLADLIDDWKPAGAMEFMYVEIIATCYQRLARAIRFERAELHMGIIEKTHDRAVVPASGVAQIDSAIHEMRTTGFLSDDTIKSLSELKTVDPKIFELNSRMVEDRKSAIEPKKEDVEALLAMLTRERQQRQRTHDELTWVNEVVTKRLAEQVAIPNPDVWERIVQYEKPVFRRIQQAEEALLRLQNRRTRHRHQDDDDGAGYGEDDREQ